MSPAEYLVMARRSEAPLHASFNPDQRRMLHAALGLTTEVGELVDPIKKHCIYSRPLTNEVLENMREEIGDILWYLAILCNQFHWSLGDIMQDNIAKLRTRYPDRFTEAAAEARADKEPPA
jgi:NTP pyrophosphatase (non-canonical NTP hydrolase)